MSERKARTKTKNIKNVGGGLTVGLLALIVFSSGITSTTVISAGTSSDTGCEETDSGGVATVSDTTLGTQYSAEQTANIKTIIGIAKGQFSAVNEESQKRAALIGIITAMVESGIRNIDYGDRDSIGMFQQRNTWGSREQRLDPVWTTAKFFFAMKEKTKDWAINSESPGTIAQTTQVSAFPLRYDEKVSEANAIISATWATSPAIASPAEFLGGTASAAPTESSGSTSGEDGAECKGEETKPGDLSGDIVALAQEIIANPNIIFMEDIYRQQVANVATGSVSANCNVDLGVLQIIQLASQTFSTLKVSDINRLCSNRYQGVGAGINSSHASNGGGHAIDLAVGDGVFLNGANDVSMKFLNALGPRLPAGAAIGQSQCRSAPLGFPGIVEFPDSCDHIHISLITQAPLDGKYPTLK